jgi:hypothetical protein
MSTVGSLTLTAQEQPGVVAYDCARSDGPTGQAHKNPQPTWLVWCLARLVQCGFREQFSRSSSRPIWSEVCLPRGGVDSWAQGLGARRGWQTTVTKQAEPRSQQRKSPAQGGAERLEPMLLWGTVQVEFADPRFPVARNLRRSSCRRALRLASSTAALSPSRSPPVRRRRADREPPRTPTA